MSKEANVTRWKLVPTEPTPEIMAAAAMAVLATAFPADLEMARKAARIVLERITQPAPGMSADMIAASIATMAPAYRAMIAESQTVMHLMHPVHAHRKAALDEWAQKTDFIQDWISSGRLPVKYLGWHRADVMRDLLEQAGAHHGAADGRSDMSANTDIAHEIFAAAQTAPGEGIEDAVARIAVILGSSAARDKHQVIGDFLERTGQYVTNDASREAALCEARKEAFDWLETEIGAVDTWYRGDPSYEHDAGWFKARALALVGDARNAFSQPSLETLSAGKAT